MTRRGNHLLALAATAAAVTLGGVAMGQAATPPALATAHAERQASGQIQLSGGGLVNLTGRLAISANLPSRGVLRLIDRAGDASVHVAGRPVRFNRNRRAAVRGARGIVFASGSDLVFLVTGGRIELSAAGIGRAALRGSGRVRVNLGRERAWPRGAIILAPGAAGRTPKRPIATGKSRRR
ncbi:MAG: hypothetical protein ACLGG9_11615 [Thermoleophilia bacterium]